MHPFHSSTTNEINLLAEGLRYYGHRFALIGFDHGTESLMLLLTILVPITFYVELKRKDYSFELNLTALICGVLAYFLVAVSFILQATLAEYAIQVYNSSAGTFGQNFAVYLYDWGMIKGGLSDSLYIPSNLLMSVWLILHCKGLKQFFHSTWIASIGTLWAIATIVMQLIYFFFLMQMKDALLVHNIDQYVGFVEVIWFPLVGIWLLRTQKASL